MPDRGSVATKQIGKLEHDFRALLEEARVVIPGVQTLLGFQLVAVFNQLFPKLMTQIMQYTHLAATALTAIAMILIMSPASFHRMAGHVVSTVLMRLSSRFLMMGMFVLATGICLDFGLIAYVILEKRVLSTFLAALLFVAFISQWFILPRRYANAAP